MVFFRRAAGVTEKGPKLQLHRAVTGSVTEVKKATSRYYQRTYNRREKRELKMFYTLQVREKKR